jgi:hypothetical protein
MIILKIILMTKASMAYKIRLRSGAFRSVFILLFCTVLNAPGFSQVNGGDKKEVTIDLAVSQVNADMVELKATAQVKLDSVLDGLKGRKVSFFTVTDSAETLLGSSETDFDGIAALTVKSDKFMPQADGRISFSASTGVTDELSEGRGDVSVKRAMLSFTSFEGDSVHTVAVKLVTLAGGLEVPVKDAEVGVFIKRLFSNYPVGELLTTDENGEASVEVPPGLSGDEKGNFTLIAKVDEHEEFGTLETRVVKPWGLKTRVDPLKQRTLWSHAPPLWMLITFIVLITVVWGHYLVIIYKLFRLKHL